MYQWLKLTNIKTNYKVYMMYSSNDTRHQAQKNLSLYLFLKRLRHLVLKTLKRTIL